MTRSYGGRQHLAVALLSLALVTACSASDEPPPPSRGETGSPPAERDPGAYADELLELTNDTREAEGLPQLDESTCAQEAAEDRAAALVGQDDLEHAPLAPVIEECEPLTTAAENLVNSSATPVEVIEAWLESPGHRANIVDPDLTELGIGCAPDGSKLLCSQVFLGP